MNRERVAGIWKQVNGKLKERWGRLTDDRRLVTAGMLDQRAGRIQERYAASKEEAARQLEEFFDRNRDWDIPTR
jgi:uncharacterized protein YjbJ (UPF0337 family)